MSEWYVGERYTDRIHINKGIGEVVAIAFDTADGEGEKRAHLIAAAPTLLEALQVVRRSMGWQYMSEETREVIRAAIQSATGETE